MTYLLLTIPNLFERRHYDRLNTRMKVQIRISGSFENVSLSHGSIVEHLKHERDNFVQSSMSQIDLYTFDDSESM